jgi:hypothetical protein
VWRLQMYGAVLRMLVVSTTRDVSAKRQQWFRRVYDVLHTRLQRSAGGVRVMMRTRLVAAERK